MLPITTFPTGWKHNEQLLLSYSEPGSAFNEGVLVSTCHLYFDRASLGSVELLTTSLHIQGKQSHRTSVRLETWRARFEYTRDPLNSVNRHSKPAFPKVLGYIRRLVVFDLDESPP